MNNDIVFRASMLEKNMNEIKENINFLDREIYELQSFITNINFLINTEETDSLSSIGKGVYVKSSIKEKTLFVEVGAKVIVKKTPQETKEIIENQIKKLLDARINLLSKLEQHQETLYDIIKQIEKTNPDALKHNHQY